MDEPPELSVVDWFERRQIPLYLAALVIGAVVGVVAPGTAPTLEGTINPTLALLLYATFLGVPMARSSGRSRMAGSSAAPCSSTSSQSRSSSSR